MREKYAEIGSYGAWAVTQETWRLLYRAGPEDATKQGQLAGIQEMTVEKNGEITVKIAGRGCCKRFSAQLLTKDIDFTAISAGEGTYTFRSHGSHSVKLLMATCMHLDYHYHQSELCRVKTQPTPAALPPGH